MKLKEQLIEMGLDEAIAQKVIDEIIDGSYIPKSRFNEVNEENKGLKTQIAERDTQLETLKKSSGDNAALQQQIADLQKANADAKTAYEKEIADMKLDSALEMALTGAKAKNSKAVRAMLDMEKVKLGEDGKLAGLDEQLEELKKSDGYMFDIAETGQRFTGFQPGASGGVPNSKSTGYETRLAEARKNNNQLEVIKIKQEAAADGVVLM